jgi:pimeloyl-ACP methyl ester carboxylesterase
MLTHVRRGSGEPLLLIHPLGGEHFIWDPVMDLLAAERDVIALDMPGFGGSPPLADGTEPTPQALARAVTGFMDELGLADAHVAGCSLGGWVAIEVGRFGRARSVTGLCTAGFWSRPLGPRPTPIRKLGRVLLPAVPLLVRTERGRRLALAGSLLHPERVPPDAAARMIRNYVTAPAYEAANNAMRAAVIEDVEALTVPLTLGWAEHDHLVRRPRRPLPGRQVVLRGCGHVPTWDDPPQVARVLLEGSAAESVAA